METHTLLDITKEKQEIVDWIATVQDISVLENLIELKRRATFNFEEEFKKGYSATEARKISKQKIKEWWRK